MVGTALALAGLGASLGGNIAKGVMQSRGAKKATQAQLQATQQAQNYLGQGMGQLGQLYSPYINSGASAMNTLGRLTTPGPGARYASLGVPNATPQFGQAAPPGYALPRVGPMPPGGPPMPYQPPRPVAGPYPMAAGGDFTVNRPTLFLAGEAGPERAMFSGAQPPGWQGFAAMAPPNLANRQGLSGRAGALQGAMRGGPAAAGANALRRPFAGMY